MFNEFRLDSVENSCYLGKDYKSNISSHSDRKSHGFVFFKEGSTEYTFKSGKQVITDTEHFLYLPKYSSYSFKKREWGCLYCINLQCNDNIFGEGDPDEKSFSFPLKRTSEIESIYKRVVREMYLKKPYYNLRVFSLVYELVSIIFSELNSEYVPSNSRIKLFPAVTYIDEHYTDRSINIPQLASKCEMSENYFRRLFVKQFGKTPTRYINERRIEYASEFLKSGLYSVSQVASIAGFEDLGYFSRVYKNITGESPSKSCIIQSAESANNN